MSDIQIVNGDTTHPLVILLTSSTDHVTGITGLSSATILAGSFVSKNGGAEAAAAGAYVERGHGKYAYTPAAAEVNTNGEWVLTVVGVAGCDPTDEKRQVVPFNIYDAAALGLTRLDVAVSTRNSVVPDNATISATAAAVTALPAAIFAYVTETGLTFVGFVRLATSALFGKSTASGDTFRDFNDTKNRITATVDSSGNRTVVTRDAT